MPIIILKNSQTDSFAFPQLKFISIRAYATRATPLPISIAAPILGVTLFTTASFITKPVKGGSPPALTSDRPKLLHSELIYLTTGANTTKYIAINHHINLPVTEKIHPI